MKEPGDGLRAPILFRQVEAGISQVSFVSPAPPRSQVSIAPMLHPYLT